MNSLSLYKGSQKMTPRECEKKYRNMLLFADADEIKPPGITHDYNIVRRIGVGTYTFPSQTGDIVMTFAPQALAAIGTGSTYSYQSAFQVFGSHAANQYSYSNGTYVYYAAEAPASKFKFGYPTYTFDSLGLQSPFDSARVEACILEITFAASVLNVSGQLTVKSDNYKNVSSVTANNDIQYWLIPDNNAISSIPSNIFTRTLARTDLATYRDLSLAAADDPSNNAVSIANLPHSKTYSLASLCNNNQKLIIRYIPMARDNQSAMVEFSNIFNSSYAQLAATSSNEDRFFILLFTGLSATSALSMTVKATYVLSRNPSQTGYADFPITKTCFGTAQNVLTELSANYDAYFCNAVQGSSCI